MFPVALYGFIGVEPLTDACFMRRDGRFDSDLNISFPVRNQYVDSKV